MKCPLDPPDQKYLAWKAEADRILKQHDAAYHNGKPPVFERKSHVEYTLKPKRK